MTPARPGRRPPMRAAWRWLAVLLVASASVLIGASARAQSPQGCVFGHPCQADSTTTLAGSGPTVSTTIPTPSTTAPSNGGHTPYAATFTPCTADGTQSRSGPCRETPADIQVSYPTDRTPPDQVQINWVAGGRSAAAPDPGTTSVTLAFSDGSGCGTDLICWSWPTALDDGPFILNGTYQLVVCPFHSSANGQCNDPLPPQSVGLAVPPGQPTSVSAHSAGSEVTISWKPPAQAPPDLVGYSVARDDTTVYTCSTDDLGPGQSTPCPSSLEVADHPGNGEYTYSVTALRLGVDTSNANVVASNAAVDSQGVVTVPGQSGSTPGGTGQGGTQVSLGPNDGGGGVVTATPGGSGTPVSLGQISAASQPPAGVSTPVPPLSYPSPTDSPKRPQALSLKVDPSSGHDDVVPVAVLALGILSLAIAAHFLYLRVELGVVQARLAARRSSGL